MRSRISSSCSIERTNSRAIIAMLPRHLVALAELGNLLDQLLDDVQLARHGPDANDRLQLVAESLRLALVYHARRDTRLSSGRLRGRGLILEVKRKVVESATYSSISRRKTNHNLGSGKIGFKNWTHASYKSLSRITCDKLPYVAFTVIW